MSFSFTIDAMVRGYHEYQSVWQAALGEKLKCVREVGNRSDVFAVAVVKAGETVGHLPRKISSIYSILLRNGGELVCEVTGSLQSLALLATWIRTHPRVIIRNIGD